MSIVAELEQKLFAYTRKPLRENLRIVGWRFAINQQEAAKVGIRDNTLGDVYSAPSMNQSCTGDLLIIWPGNLCSHAVVNRAVVADLENKLPLWRQAAYHDPAGAVLLDPAPFPLVAVEDQQVRELVIKNPEPLFRLLVNYLEELPKWQITSIQAGASAGWGLRHIRSSKGLSLSYALTSFSTYAAADGLFSQQFAKRRLPTAEESEELIRSLGTTVKYLKQESGAIGGRIPVIFSPRLVGEFCARYLLSNLSGNSVVNSQGAFSLQDFEHRRQVFDPRVNMIIDPLKPYELGSYLCTREGVPAQRQALVKNGQLITPYLTVKDATKAGLKPTSLPQGSGVFLEVDESMEYGQLISSLQSGLLVHSVMGLHTQDSTSGAYSLSAPLCLRIENGKIVGRVKAVISGNFLEHLAQPATQFAKSPGEEYPAMQFTCNVVTA